MTQVPDSLQPARQSDTGIVQAPAPVQVRFAISDEQLQCMGLTRLQLSAAGLPGEKAAALEAVLHLKALQWQIGSKETLFSLFEEGPGFDALFGHDPKSGKPHFPKATLDDYLRRNFVARLREPCGPDTDHHRWLMEKLPGPVNTRRLGAIIALLQPNVPSDPLVGCLADDIARLKDAVGSRMPRSNATSPRKANPSPTTIDPLHR